MAATNIQLFEKEKFFTMIVTLFESIKPSTTGNRYIANEEGKMLKTDTVCYGNKEEVYHVCDGTVVPNIFYLAAAR